MNIIFEGGINWRVKTRRVAYTDDKPLLAFGITCFNLAPPCNFQSSGAGGATYDPYPGSKRPLDQGYDGSFNAPPYDPAYNDSYERSSGYPSSDYDRTYDQGYVSYGGRDDYRREGGYGPEEYNHPPYDHSADMTSERAPMFDNPPEQGYGSNPQDPSHTGGEAFKTPNKRPRY